MFKNIQKKLLLQYPLLWNTKFVPMVIIGLILHLIFFGLGYIDGTIDFSDRTNYDILPTAMLFGVLLAIIILILWLVNYLKNNALKSFYSKSKYSLFYEWAQIFIVCLLLTTFYLPFSVGKKLHQKSYYSLEETQKRCKTIATANLFIYGSFGETAVDSVLTASVSPEELEKINRIEYHDGVEYQDTNYTYFRKDHIYFKGKKYDEYSLLNRNISDFSVFSHEQDSLHEIEIKNYLHTNYAAPIKKLMKDYLNLIKEHQLATNLTPEIWFQSTYKAPDFTDFLYIQPYLRAYEDENSYYVSEYATTEPEYQKNSKYSKYVVQHQILSRKYDIVSYAHTKPFFEIKMILSLLYVALGFSILIFSFRVTSGKSWLITVVTTGVLNIVYGIMTAVSGFDLLYFYLMLFTILANMVYFFYIYFTKKSIQLSRISLNLLLWSFATIIPIVYFLVQGYYRYKNYYENNSNYYDSPEYQWLEKHLTDMFVLNFVVTIVAFFLLSKTIRNWKGIAED